jgi:uncharacterized membrane protein YgdD (TMEM256/DUF423 family)
MNARYTLLIAGVSGALAVGLGAFGAHALESMLMESGRLDTYETAVKYHFYHSLLLMMLGLLRLSHHSMPHLKTAIHCCMAGIIIFSGSLYILCLTGSDWLGAVTPIGGLLLISSWLLTGVGAWKHFKE